MSITGLSASSQAVYLQYLTGSSDSKASIISELFSTVYGAGSTSTTSTTSSYLEQASEGTVLTDAGQKAAQAELRANIYGSLFDLTV